MTYFVQGDTYGNHILAEYTFRRKPFIFIIRCRAHQHQLEESEGVCCSCRLIHTNVLLHIYRSPLALMTHAASPNLLGEPSILQIKRLKKIVVLVTTIQFLLVRSRSCLPSLHSVVSQKLKQ
ncbi:unnamed protein product [Albugo candida]|uniref:Uncharacterized protein n=1 Tax=Albugo candida TaxID=65357 RepID=A0A024GFB9_9STRA|nr:unnamed protein product [Albugo candida]|eukprot:CCI45238.1 unnamed protein product [Albugo candida]